MDLRDNILDERWEEIPDEAKARIEENERLRSSFNELAMYHAALKQDVEVFRENSSSGNLNSQSWRRSLIRLVFEWIEGVTHLMKQVAQSTQGGFINAAFSPAELAVIRGESYALAEDGVATIEAHAYPGVARNLRLAHGAVAKGFGIDGKLKIKNGPEWQLFREVVAVRERITRPESLDELTINDDELEALLSAIDWFNEQISALFFSVEETLEPISARIRAEGKVAQKVILDNALAALHRAGEVDSILKVVDTLLDAEDGLVHETAEELFKARAKLKDLRGFFLNSWDA